MAFTHLHVHTEYSLLDGSSKIKELVARAAELGMTSLAITDYGVMYGAIDFYRACLAEGIKPILGCEVYVAPGSRLDKEGSVSDERYRHLVLLAENDVGYHNLMKIVSIGFTEGFYYKPRVDDEILREYHTGIIALSACLAGEVPRLLVRGFYQEAKEAALKMQEIFGAGNYFLEMQDHGISEQKLVNQGLLKISAETGIPLVATNDSHYTLESDAVAHDVLLCIQTQKKVADTDRLRYEGGQFYLKSEEEMRTLFPYAPEALDNTAEIAARCQVEIEFGKYKLPRFDVPEGYTAWEYFRQLCEKGLVKRYGTPTEALKSRLAYEMKTIADMGFVDYFIIVWDFIRFAKENGIVVGPGRGSAAGSVVSYCLEITDIDPLRFDLLFERFLNPERVTMPDIDIDFCFERRQEVIDYVVRKYGKDRVVQIVTFGTMAARGVLRDVGRAMDIPYARVDALAKMIPNQPGVTITIEKAMEINSELAQLYNSDEEVRTLVDMAKRLEGLPRHTSVHAAGVVICDAPAQEYVPLSRSSDDMITTQFTMTTLEELGLLKMDFLGLRTLTVIQSAERLVNRGIQEGRLRLPEQMQGELAERAQTAGIQEEPLPEPVSAADGQAVFSVEKLDYADAGVFELIASGKTEGVFQLESSGMTGFMKELKPESLDDIIAGIALYRPGPMDFIPKYIKGKQHSDEIQYDCAELEPILRATYGCIVYQEQVMQIVRELAGYSYGRSDLVRRAMSKKKTSVMAKERQNFVYGNPEEGVAGCIAKGISEEVANKIFDEMTDFAKYAFNKSHAAAYAVVAYQTAYLKRYYPVEFMAALMTSVIDTPAKVAEYIFTCRQMGIVILPPDINESEAVFSVKDGKIQYALSAIKSVGRTIIDLMITERMENGCYRSLVDLIERTSSVKDFNRRVVEHLIKAGALDSLPGNRRQKIMIYQQVLDGIAYQQKKSVAGQLSLFDFAQEETEAPYEAYRFPEVTEFDKPQLLANEKEVLGIYVSGHPLESDLALLEKNITATTSAFVIDEETGMPQVEDEAFVTVGGMLVSKTLKATRSNQTMAFLTIEDLYGQLEILVFPRDYEKYRGLLVEETKLLIRGRVTIDEERGAKLICQRIHTFDEVPRTLWIRFPDVAARMRAATALEAVLQCYDGKNEVILYCEAEKKKEQLPKNKGVRVCEELLSQLYESYGEPNVKTVFRKLV